MAPHISFRSTVHTAEDRGNVVTAITDVPSHCWLRFSTHSPRIHKQPVLRRGMWLNDDVRFCFTVFTDLEQLEPGDTLTHTFVMQPCQSLLTLWYYLWGYVDDVLSPSTSTIIAYPPTLVCPSVLVITLDALEDNRTIRRTWGTWALTHDFPTGIIQPFHDPPNYVLVARASRTVSYWLYRAFLQFDTGILPIGSTITDALLVLFVDSVEKTAQVPERHIIVTQGVQDTPIVSANYGDQLPYTTNGGQVHLDDCNPGDVAAITLNAAGIPWIVPQGLTRLCVRQELDVVDKPPTLGANALNFNSAQDVYWRRPKLVIRYQPP